MWGEPGNEAKPLYVYHNQHISSHLYLPAPCFPPYILSQDSVAVCAAVIRYHLCDRPRTGVCTTFLQDRVAVGETCPVFISHNPDFRLPSDGEVPIIMIGPGTGLAPFRAFIQERGLWIICCILSFHPLNASIIPIVLRPAPRFMAREATWC